jgi:hypothetical protein
MASFPGLTIPLVCPGYDGVAVGGGGRIGRVSVGGGGGVLVGFGFGFGSRLGGGGV